MSGRVYLDYNATAPVREEAREAIRHAIDLTGNASSVHEEGRRVRALVETARADVAALVGAPPESVVFTSGGTEANNQALTGFVESLGIDRILVSAIEHPSVLEAARNAGVELIEIPVSEDGLIQARAVGDLLGGAGGAKPLASVMLANNETGVIQPVAEIAEIVHAAGGYLHTDAVQAAGKVDVDMDALGADLLSLSAHKLGGPQGVGALFVREGLLGKPLMRGGGQERGRRGGTENLPGIAGFGAAAKAARLQAADMAHVAKLHSVLEARLREIAPEVVVFGDELPRLPNTTHMAVDGMSSETLVIALDLAGFAVSAGSACSSGKVKHSSVLHAMGIGDGLAGAAIRVSLGPQTQDSDIDGFLEAFTEAHTRFKQRQQAA